MKILVEIRESGPQEARPWTIYLSYRPRRRCTTTYANSLEEAFKIAHERVLEDL